MATRENPLWDRDDVQFPRLLAEIKAVGLTSEQLRGLKASMDLETGDICEILDRAEEAFESIKTTKQDWCCDPRHHCVPCPDPHSCNGCLDECSREYIFNGTLAEAYEELAKNWEEG